MKYYIKSVVRQGLNFNKKDNGLVEQMGVMVVAIEGDTKNHYKGYQIYVDIDPSKDTLDDIVRKLKEEAEREFNKLYNN